MNKTLKSIVMMFIICALGYTQIGCKADNIKNENPQAIKDYSNQVQSEDKSNQNSNESKDDNGNLTSQVEKLSSNAEIHFIDTGNSDAILIIKDNKAALIDGGDNDDEALVSSYIKKQGISELEYVFATHPHADHIGGLDRVAKEIKINNLYVSNGEADTKSYRDFINEAANKGLYPSVPLLGSKFDSWNGEAFYSDKMSEIVEILEKSGKLIESEGAKIVDLEDKGINTPCIIEKSNGSSTYATRDLAAIMYRARTYDFDKALYVTSYEQVLHFKQIFEVAKLLGLDEKYTNVLEHVSFGMVLLPTGKMSTREGTSVKLLDLLNEAISRAKLIIEQKNPELENKDEVAKRVGVGAVIFNDLANNRVKDEIFDWDTILNFQGETGPYIQYTYVRTKSVIEKAGGVPQISAVDSKLLQDEYSIKLLKLIYDFEDVLVQVTDKNEPSILSRYLIDVAKAYSNFYNENKIINEDKELQDARVYLTYSVGKILSIGAGLLGIEMPERM